MYNTLDSTEFLIVSPFGHFAGFADFVDLPDTELSGDTEVYFVISLYN